MSAEAQIVESLNAARKAYHEASTVESEPFLVKRRDDIKALMAKLDEALCPTEKPCPLCGGEPHGRLKTPGYSSKGSRVAAVYAVQCLNAKCLTAEVVPMSVGQTPEVAAFAWEREIFGG